MRDDVKLLLERQAAWQRSRATRPWSEKLRAAVAMRRGLIALRKRPARERKVIDEPVSD
jgi:hypothetical protein